MSIDNIRQQFPALEQLTFLDSACVSLAPQRTIAKLQAFLEMTAYCPSGSSTQHHIDMDAMRSAARPQVARLINASEDEIALVESTTHGLSLVANALPLKRGDRVVLSDLEFLEVAVPWVQKREEIGIEIDVLPNRDGQISVEDIEAALTPETKVLAISSVQWNNGFLCDLDAVSQLCRERGVFLIVDAVQQIGSIPFDVQKTPVDALACGGHKWLMSPFGCGFLYLSQAVSRPRSIRRSQDISPLPTLRTVGKRTSKRHRSRRCSITISSQTRAGGRLAEPRIIPAPLPWPSRSR